MSTPAATEQSSGFNAAQAADAFEAFLNPEEGKAEGNEQDETKPEDEAEQEAEEEGESENAVPEGDEADAGTLHTVKVDGKESKVSTEELVKGYQREADYTRKTMALAEQRKAAESEFAAVREERANYAKVLGQLQEQIRQNEPQIDWARLQQENPNEWTRQRLLALDRQTALQNVEAERRRVAEAEQVEQDKSLGERIEAGNKALSDAIPEWKDAAKAKTEKAALVEYLHTVAGFQPGELDQVYDHRPILLARKAMLYDQLVAKRATLKPVVAAAPEPVKAAKPGNAGASSKTSEVANAHQRLARTGNVRDAAALFERLI